MAPCCRCPAPDPNPSVTPCWFDVTVLGRTILKPRCRVGGCFATGGSCQWDQSFDRLPAPRWPLPWKTSQLQVLRPLLVPEPVPCWGHLATAALPHWEGSFGVLADSPLCLSPASLASRFFSSCSSYLSITVLSVLDFLSRRHGRAIDFLIGSELRGRQPLSVQACKVTITLAWV